MKNFTTTLLVIGAVTIGFLSTALGQSTALNARLARLDDEPSIRDVQLAALRYYKLDKTTVEAQQSAAGLKGLIPTLGVSTGFTTTGSNDETLNDEYGQISDDVIWLANRAFGNSFSISGNLSWNLPSLAFSGESLAVLGRTAKRESILKEVTSLYYKRRKLQIDMQVNPPDDDQARALKKLDIEQQTAMLDAYTGGWFSKEVGN